MVQTSNYLYLNKEIDFANLPKMFVQGAERKLWNQPCKIILVESYYVPIINIKSKSPSMSAMHTAYIFI